MAETGIILMPAEERRKLARYVAIAAGVAWLGLFFLGFSNRSPAITYSRWAALIVLFIAWSYSSSNRNP